jgi:tetratricopeptide (TPR) repeat protein
MEKKGVTMNKAVTWFFLIIITLSAQVNETIRSSKTDNWINTDEEATVYDSILVKEINCALADPYRFIRRGGLGKLITTLKNNARIVIQVVPPDSLTDEKINSKKIRRNNYDRCVLHIIRYAQERNHNSEIAQQSLYTAALLAFRKIDNPKLALSIYELAVASGYKEASDQAEKIKYYLEHEHSFTSLLKEPWRRKKEKEKRAYISQLQEVLDKNSGSLLELKFSKQIGDVYYSMESYRPMIRWYRKAVAIDSTIEKETPIGYRMETGRKVLLRKSVLTGIYIIYCIIILIIIATIFRLKSLQGKLFLRRLLIGVPAFIIIAAITLFLDFKISSGTIASALSKSDVFFPKPIVPFSIFDSSCIKDLSIILLFGFLPVLLSILYTSFRNNHSRKLLFILLPLTIISTWSHYIINKVYDERLNKRAVITKSHIYFDGELEKLLPSNPQKVLKANPNLLKSNNKDLEIFIKENKPQLLNGK